MSKNIQVVVTGASGFVAKNVRKHLSLNEFNLISISRKNFQKLKKETKIVSSDYKEKDILPKIKNSYALIHLVGIGKQSIKNDYNSINLGFTKKIIDLCKKAYIKKIIFTSGLGVSKTTSLGYFISKYRAEQQIIESGLNYTIFRPSYIVGKDDLLTKYLKNQIKTKEIKIPGSGNYSIQPIYINDVSKVIAKSLLDNRFEKKTLDLVGSESLTFQEYVKLFSMNKIKIKKLNLETCYNDAINNPQSKISVDDLNLLIGDFKGNHKKLSKISKIPFESIRELLKSGRLLQ
ncbi:MAG: SDR family oxidoreductase [Candidatus Nitrosomaritimum aestuariumsis]|jgi:NADH dehydrogenase